MQPCFCSIEFSMILVIRHADIMIGVALLQVSDLAFNLHNVNLAGKLGGIGKHCAYILMKFQKAAGNIIMLFAAAGKNILEHSRNKLGNNRSMIIEHLKCAYCSGSSEVFHLSFENSLRWCYDF